MIITFTDDEIRLSLRTRTEGSVRVEDMPIGGWAILEGIDDDLIVKRTNGGWEVYSANGDGKATFPKIEPAND